MDIGQISMQIAMAKNLSDVGTKMLSNTLDMQKVEGNGIVEMMNAQAMSLSVNPHIGSNFDMSV